MRPSADEVESSESARLESSGEFIDGQALSPDGVWGRHDGEGRPPVADGPFAETTDLIVGSIAIDVDSFAATSLAIHAGIPAVGAA